MKATLCILFLPVAVAGQGFLESSTRIPEAPPEPPPALSRALPAAEETVFPASQTLYTIGEPTDEEQLYLEYMNRSRANPQAEAQRFLTTTDPRVLAAYSFFGVDLELMVAQFDAIAAAPPLSMNSNLTRAARLHSGDMFTNQFQGHTGSNGSTLSQRVNASGYLNWSTLAENVFSYAESVFHGHAGFDVDWGTHATGMQTPPGHRNAIHNASYREVGVGVVIGSNGTVGPQLVTQNFGSRFGLTPFVTGVVYYDFDGNGFYDLGEGIGGVTVDVAGSTYYAVSADSGGYSVPVPGNGSYTVTFSGDNLPATQFTVLVAEGQNVKADHSPSYSPPVVSGPSVASANQANPYSFSAVGAATGYRWRQARRAPFTAVEGAEDGMGGIIANLSAGYSLIVTDSKASGSSSFRMAHPTPPVTQWFEVDRTLRLSVGSQLQFASRLGWASPSQVAQAQISADGGTSWETVWSQAGTSTSGESGFGTKSISLAAFAGKEVRVRFVYDHLGGVYYAQTSSGVGFYVDNIAVTNADELLDVVETEIGSTTFEFVPAVVNANYLLAVSARVSGRYLPYGPAHLVASEQGVAQARIASIVRSGATQLEIDFEVWSGAASGFQLERALDPAGPWSHDAGAVIQTLVAGVEYRATTTTSGATARYYRVRVLP